MLKYCFLDTNILIHFQTFDEVDWCSGLEASEVVLVFAPVVMREMNQHKDDSRNKWRQKRARILFSKLKWLLKGILPGDSISIKEAVSILEVPREPKVDWGHLGLDPQINDDRLLATIIEFADTHPPDSMVFISDDFHIQRRAALYSRHYWK